MSRAVRRRPVDLVLLIGSIGLLAVAILWPWEAPMTAPGTAGSTVGAPSALSVAPDPGTGSVGSIGATGSPASERQPITSGDQPAGAQVVLQIVDPEQTPIPAAHVWWVDQSPAIRQRSNTLDAQLRDGSTANRVHAIGNRATSDASGRVALSVVGPMLMVLAERGDFGGSALFQLTSPPSPPEQPLVLVLERGDALRVQAVDSAGAPVVDLPLALWWGPQARPESHHGAARTVLGHTDQDGRLTCRGFRQFVAEHERTIAHSTEGWLLGPGHVGVIRAALVPVPAPPITAEIRIVVTPPVRHSFQFVDVTGRPAERIQAILKLQYGSDMEPFSAVVAKGRTELLLAAERSYQWQLAGHGVDFGHGGVFIARDSRESELRCQDLVFVTGAIAEPPDLAAVTVEFSSRAMGPVRLDLPLSAARFELAVGRREIDAQGGLLFRSGERRFRLDWTPPITDEVDLGQLSFGDSLYCRIDVVDETGKPVADAFVSLLSPADAPAAPALVAADGPGRFAVHSATRPGSLQLRCDAPGRLTTQVAASSGQQLEVALHRSGSWPVVVRVPADVPVAELFVRVMEFWDPKRAAWVEASAPGPWPVSSTDIAGQGEAQLAGLRAGNHRVALMAMRPPSIVHRQAVTLGGGEPAVLDAAVQVRAFELQVDLPAGIQGPVYVGSMRTFSGEGEALPGQFLLMTPVGNGGCVLAADERELLLLGSGLRPQLLAVGAHRRLTVTAREWSGGQLPGVGQPLVALRPVPSMWRPGRPIAIYRRGGDGVLQVKVTRLDSVESGQPQWLLPCDYEGLDPAGNWLRCRWDVTTATWSAR